MTLPLIFLLLCSCLFSSSADEIQKCFPDFDVINELENRYGLYFYDDFCHLKYDFENIAADIFLQEKTELTVTNVNVSFAGYVIPPRQRMKKTTVNFLTMPITVKRSKKNGDSRTIPECKIISSDNFNLSLSLSSDAVTAAIIQYTEVCVQSYVCQHFEEILSDRSISIETHDSGKTNSTDNAADDEGQDATSKSPLSCDGVYNPQQTINTMIDFGLSVVVSKFINNNDGIFEIPEISLNYSTGSGIFKTTGEVEAANGTFADLRGLKRTEDLIIKNEGLKFIAGSTYRLSKAQLQFDHYRVRYGIIKISGHLAVDIHGISAKVRAAFDFNAKPCKAEIMMLEIEEFGDIDVDFTGLGFLNKPMQKLLEWLIKKKTFDLIKDVAADQMSELDCEQFRPTIELA